MEEPGFWDDPERSQKAMKELKHLKDTVEQYRTLETAYEDVEVLIEMGYEENDPELIPEVEEALDQFIKDFEDLKISTLLSEEYDQNNAILTLHAGAGGTEACDWTGMLFRMYSRWAEKKGYSTEVLDYLDGDEAGIKAVTLQINGENAYGYLKSEKGIHRMYRSMMKISVSIRIVPAALEASMSTKRLLLSGSPICPRALWSSVRMSVHSI